MEFTSNLQYLMEMFTQKMKLFYNLLIQDLDAFVSSSEHRTDF